MILAQTDNTDHTKWGQPRARDLPPFLIPEQIMNESAYPIREAKVRDASRLAEILIFSKRLHYRKIFRDYDYSFGVMQVLPLARRFEEEEGSLSGYYVYDDGIVKGLIHLDGDEIKELYADPLFENVGIGSALMSFALERILHPQLWVLEGNDQAVRFYRSKGFIFTGERKLVPDSDKYESQMRHIASTPDIIGKTVRVIIDRPLGSCHPDHPDLVYPVNYGFVEGIPGGDGEDQDVYVLGVQKPVSDFIGKIIAVVHRENDIEEKWVAAPFETDYTADQIMKAIYFQEKYFSSSVITN